MTMTLRQADSRRRGTVLILVVAVIVMLAVIGTAYLQVARVQRSKPTVFKNLPTVLQSVVNEIKSQLLRDIKAEDGVTFFDQSGTTVGIEPYDLAWSNTAVDWPGTATWPLRGGTPGTAEDPVDNTPGNSLKGGLFDDLWLASTQPETDTASGFAWKRWPKISRLTPRYFTTSGSDPADLSVGTVSGHWYTGGQDLNVDFSTASSKLVDTDLDGIGDAYWERTPIPQMTGITYYMAVRIIDLSAMVNANVALAQIDSGGNYSPYDNAPSWAYPSELDLGRFVLGTGVTAAELRALLDYRLGAATAIPTPLSSDRLPFWLEGVSRYGSDLVRGNYKTGSPFQALSLTDEVELRAYGGRGDGIRSGQLETLMPTFLKANSQPPTVDPTTATAVQKHFALSSTLANSNPRQWMTVLGGSSIYAPPVTTAGSTYKLKTDVNRAAVTDLSDTIEETYAQGSPTIPLGLSAANFGDQLAANIADYVDADNYLTNVGSRWGLEALPFIAEVYAQREYLATSSVEQVPPGSNIFDVTWTAQHTAGFAIEIRNPTRKPILLKDVHLWLVPAGGAAVDAGDLETLAGGFTSTPNQLAPDEVLVFYRNSGGSAGSDTVTNLITSITVNPVNPVNVDLASAGVAWPTTASGNAAVDVRVELRAASQGGSALPWAYSAAQTKSLPNSYVETGTTTDWFALARRGFKQVGAVGNGNGVNVMLIDESSFAVKNGEPSSGYDPDLDALGEADKTGVSGPGDVIAATAGQIIIADRRMDQVGEVAHILALGPSPTQTVGVARGTASFVSLMIDPSNTTALVGAGNLAVPHAVLLMERLTTMSPNEDLEIASPFAPVDNDSDGTANTGNESFIPGTINLNTAPLEVLRRVLPIPDVTLRDNVAQAIIEYRDATTRVGGYRSGIPGIAYTGELMQQLESLMPGGDTWKIGVAQTDFLSNPADTSPTEAGQIAANGSDADGVVGDREQLATLGRWLMQVGSPRSDVFAAYILIKGYKSDNTLAESGRFLVLFHRAQLTNAVNFTVMELKRVPIQ